MWVSVGRVHKDVKGVCELVLVVLLLVFPACLATHLHHAYLSTRHHDITHYYMGRTVLGARLGTWLSGWGGDYQMGSRERIFGVEVGLKEDWNGGEFLGG